MKKVFITAIKSGDSIDDVFILTEKILGRKRDGNPFLTVSLADRTGSIKGVVWDNVDQLDGRVAAGDVVRIQGVTSEYKGALQMVVKTIECCSPDGFNPADFLPATTRNVDSMFERLLQVSESVEDKHLKALLQFFWEDAAFVKKFKCAPAAKLMHHAYLGGLLEHTLSTTLLVDRVVGHYSGLDRDLLIAGAILHDIGKVEEFEYEFKIDYTDAGRLLNHIVIGVRMLDEKLKLVETFPPERAVLLRHMVVSHHGCKEFGSPEPPKTLEAVLLNYLDEIDSKINGIRQFMATQTANAHWTAYHRILERHFYLGNTSPA